MAGPNSANKSSQSRPKGSQGGPPKGKKVTGFSQASKSSLPQRSAALAVGKAHPLKSKNYSFFDFPGEIRNRIYDYIFDNRRVFVRKAHGRKKMGPDNDLTDKDETSPESCTEPRKKGDTEASKPYCGLYSDSIINGRRVKRDDKQAHINIDFLFTNSKAYREGICFLYANTTFYFASFKPIRRFLNHCRPEALAAIENLEFYHVIYGEPALTVDREWKMRSDDRWMEICIEMSKKLSGLQKLRIDLRICDWPTQLNLEAAWAQPLLELGERKFSEVKALLIHPCFKPKQLDAAARVLEEAMMCEESVEERRQQEALRMVEWQKGKEREREQQAALEKMPVVERIEWEAMLAAAEEKAMEQAAKAPKVLKITIPKHSPHWKQHGEKKPTTNGSSTQVLGIAGPSTAGNQAQAGAIATVPKKNALPTKGNVYESGYYSSYGNKPEEELMNPYGHLGLSVMKWDPERKTWNEKWIRLKSENW